MTDKSFAVSKTIQSDISDVSHSVNGHLLPGQHPETSPWTIPTHTIPNNDNCPADNFPPLKNLKLSRVVIVQEGDGDVGM